jgi:transposase
MFEPLTRRSRHQNCMRLSSQPMMALLADMHASHAAFRAIFTAAAISTSHQPASFSRDPRVSQRPPCQSRTQAKPTCNPALVAFRDFQETTTKKIQKKPSAAAAKVLSYACWRVCVCLCAYVEAHVNILCLMFPWQARSRSGSRKKPAAEKPPGMVVEAGLGKITFFYLRTCNAEAPLAGPLVACQCTSKNCPSWAPRLHAHLAHVAFLAYVIHCCPL